MAEEEVQPLVNVFDVDTLGVSTSTQNQLLKVQEGALVGNMLANLQTWQRKRWSRGRCCVASVLSAEGFCLFLLLLVGFLNLHGSKYSPIKRTFRQSSQNRSDS